MNENVYSSSWYCSKYFKEMIQKLYAPVVTLLTQDNIKLLKLLESGFKRTINWNKYLRKKIKREKDI